jgi:hypothetical protein
VATEVLTDRLSPPQAPAALTAHEIQRGCHSVAFAQSGDIVSHQGDGPCDLVSEDVGERSRSLSDTPADRHIETIDGAALDTE